MELFGGLLNAEQHFPETAWFRLQFCFDVHGYFFSAVLLGLKHMTAGAADMAAYL